MEISFHNIRFVRLLVKANFSASCQLNYLVNFSLFLCQRILFLSHECLVISHSFFKLLTLLSKFVLYLNRPFSTFSQLDHQLIDFVMLAL